MMTSAPATRFFPMKGQGIKVHLFSAQVEKISALQIGVHGIGHKCRGYGQGDRTMGEWRRSICP